MIYTTYGLPPLVRLATLRAIVYLAHCIGKKYKCDYNAGTVETDFITVVNDNDSKYKQLHIVADDLVPTHITHNVIANDDYINDDPHSLDILTDYDILMLYPRLFHIVFAISMYKDYSQVVVCSHSHKYLPYLQDRFKDITFIHDDNANLNSVIGVNVVHLLDTHGINNMCYVGYDTSTIVYVYNGIKYDVDSDVEYEDVNVAELAYEYINKPN